MNTRCRTGQPTHTGEVRAETKATTLAYLGEGNERSRPGGCGREVSSAESGSSGHHHHHMAKGRDARLGDLAESASRLSEHFTWLDRPSYRLGHAMALTFTLFCGASDRVLNVLNGTYVGHPVHPVAATVPVGAWTVALLLDAVDTLSPRPPGFREATRLTVAVGVAGSAAAAVTGLADWQYTHDGIGIRVA